MDLYLTEAVSPGVIIFPNRNILRWEYSQMGIFSNRNILR
jgi:hypothetical protein